MFKLAINEAKSSAPPDARLATSLNNLAVVSKTQGKYDQAEPSYKRSLAIREKALGADHPDVASCLENHAALLEATNRSGEATELRARAETMRARYRQP